MAFYAITTDDVGGITDNVAIVGYILGDNGASSNADIVAHFNISDNGDILFVKNSIDWAGGEEILQKLFIYARRYRILKSVSVLVSVGGEDGRSRT